MPRKTAHDYDQELLILFDAYVHGGIDRRTFLDRAAKFAVGGVTAAMLLDELSPRFADAQVVRTDDRRIEPQYIEFDSPRGSGKGRGYLVAPSGAAGKLPGILVIHENRGLNPHIEDIARRIALDNFVAFAPDALFPARRLSRAPKTRPAPSSSSSTRRRSARISSRRPGSSDRDLNATEKSGRSGSATAAGW